MNFNHFNSPHARAQRILALLDQIDAACRFSSAAVPDIEMDPPKMMAPDYVNFRREWRFAIEGYLAGDLPTLDGLNRALETEIRRQARWARFEARVHRFMYGGWTFLGRPTDTFEPELTPARTMVLVVVAMLALLAVASAIQFVGWLGLAMLRVFS